MTAAVASPESNAVMLTGRLMSPVTTPAQALWECREHWFVAVLVAGRCEVHYCSKSVSLSQPAFDAFVQLLHQGYPCDRKVLRHLTSDKEARSRLASIGISVRVRERWIKGYRRANQPLARPRPPALSPRKYKLSSKSLARLSQFGMDVDAT